MTKEPIKLCSNCYYNHVCQWRPEAPIAFKDRRAMQIILEWIYARYCNNFRKAGFLC